MSNLPSPLPARTWGVIFLSLWLIITGAVVLLGLTFNAIVVVQALLAILAGLLLLYGVVRS